MRKKRSKRLIALAVAGALAAAVAAVAFLSYTSPWRSLARIESALARGDSAEVDSLVDMPSVRDYMTSDLAYKALRSAGIPPGDERVLPLVVGVQNTVNLAMTAPHLAEILAKAKAESNGARPKIRGEYLNVGVFVFAIEPKGGQGALSLRLRRRGPMSWRLDKIIIIDAGSLAGG